MLGNFIPLTVNFFLLSRKKFLMELPALLYSNGRESRRVRYDLE